MIKNVKIVDVREIKLEKDLNSDEEIFAYIPINFIKKKLVNFGDKKSGVNIYGARYELTKNYSVDSIETKTNPKTIRKWKQQQFNL